MADGGGSVFPFPFVVGETSHTKPSEASFPDLEFREMLQACGMDVDRVIPDGKIHRIDGEDDKRGQRSAWYVFYPDGVPSGAFGDWHDGETQTWCSVARSDLTVEQRSEVDKRMLEARASREAETKSRQAAARAEVVRQLDGASLCHSHAYLTRKQVKTIPGLRVDNDGSLLVPMTDATGTVWNAQRIYEDGTKRYWSGAKKNGCYFLIGEPKDKLIIVEGLATGASVHEATGVPVAVAFDTSNLTKAGRAVMTAHPRAQVVFAADNDRHTPNNPGITAASKAADELGVSYVFPSFTQDQGVDYNDLAVLEGVEAVREQIMGKDPLDALPWINADQWDNVEPEPLEWIWKDWVPRGLVSAVYGDGGTGKTLFLQQFATCCATGTRFFGESVGQYRVAYVFSEDNDKAIQRRQKVIDQYYNLKPGDKHGNLLFLPLNDRPALIAQKIDGVWVWTKVMHDIFAALKSFGAEVFIFDAIADAFPENENIRSEVTSFMTATLTYVATTMNIGVIFLGHNSKGGRESGSTAWRAKTKSLIMMEKDEEDRNAVTVTRGKANDAAEGEQIFLYHKDRVLMPVEEIGDKPVDQAAEKRKNDIDDRVLRVIVEADRIGSPVKVSNAKAELMTISHAGGYGLQEDTILISLSRLALRGRILQEGAGASGKTMVYRAV